MIAAVVFDVDGVLIDTVELSYRARAKVLQEYGVDLDAIPDPQNEKHKGGSLANVLAAVKKHTGLELDQAELSHKIRRSIADELETHNISVSPDLQRLLNDLKSHGVAIAVATSASKEGTSHKLRLLGLEDAFQAVITGIDVKEHKPHPESYLLALKRLGARPSESIVFEDSAAGIEAGRAAGCVVVGFTKYNDQKGDLPGATITIDSWSDVTYDKLLQLMDLP